MKRKESITIRPIWVKDYCVNEAEVRPFYWLEESAELYAKANNLVNKLKKMERIIDSPELELLADIDTDLIELWQSFEKEAMTGIGKISEGTIASIKLPTIFGYPDIIYYHHGILIFHTYKEHVRVKSNSSHGERMQRHNGS